MEIIGTIFMDSQKVEKEDLIIKKMGSSNSKEKNLLEEYEELFDRTKKQLSVNFVGFVLHPEGSIVSFPKNYFPENSKPAESSERKEKLLKDAKKLFKALFKAEVERKNKEKERKNKETFFGESMKQEVPGNFPIVAYQNVCDYYLRFGIFNKAISKSVENYGGNIDWPKTIRSSEVFLSGGNFVFLPFYVKQKDYLHVFISECMKYVLSDGYQRFGSIFDFGVRYQDRSSNPLFRDRERVIRELKIAEAEHFKDSDLRLIRSLIEYFEWKRYAKGKVFFLTQSFAHNWERMVEKYLNDCFDEVSECGKISFKKNSLNRERFNQKEEAVNWKKDPLYLSEEDFIGFIKNGLHNFGFFSHLQFPPDPSSFKVRYDHFFIPDNKKIAYIFDSKYYDDMSGLDYKQLAYSFIYKGNHKETHNGEEIGIIAGLILPAPAKEKEEKVEFRCHCNRFAVDNIVIYEYYLPVRNVIDNYLE